MFRTSCLTNFFNNPNTSLVKDQVRALTETTRPSYTIKVVHTPVVLPLGTCNEIGGYARSIGCSFGPKVIALNVERFLEESPYMQKFILLRQIAQFDKNSRCLHIPMAAVAIGVATLASTILFSASMSTAGALGAVVALLSAAIINAREQTNELDADKKAFSYLQPAEKQEVIDIMKQNILQNRPRNLFFSFVDAICSILLGCNRETAFTIYSGYPSLRERYFRLSSQNRIHLGREVLNEMRERRNFTRHSRATATEFNPISQEEFVLELLQVMRESNSTPLVGTEGEDSAPVQRQQLTNHGPITPVPLPPPPVSIVEIIDEVQE